MSFEIIPAANLPLSEQAAVVNAAFAGYVGGWTDLNAEGLARFLCLQGVDLFYSRFVRANGLIAGFGYVNRTGRILRLGAMALLPEARGTGAAAFLLDHLCAEGKNRGDEAMVLEVIEQNPRAHAFYRRCGFRELTRLAGWRRGPTKATTLSSDDLALEELTVAATLNAHVSPDYPEIPWPISRHAMAKVERTRAFRAAGTSVIVSEPEQGMLRLHGFFSERRDWSALKGATEKSFRQFHEHEIFLPPVFPEVYGEEIFQPLGFKREPLTQFFMRRDF